MDDIARHRPLKPSGKRNKMPFSIVVVEITSGLTMIAGVSCILAAVIMRVAGEEIFNSLYIGIWGLLALVSGAGTMAFVHIAKAVIEIRDMARARL